MAYLGRAPQFGEFRKVDVSSWAFNASNVSFPLGKQVGDVNQLVVSLNAVIQEPTKDYLLQAGGNNIVFTTAPDSGDSCFALVMGNSGASITTGSITEDKLAANLKTFDELPEYFKVNRIVVHYHLHLQQKVHYLYQSTVSYKHKITSHS